jgi:hypothetical protein
MQVDSNGLKNGSCIHRAVMHDNALTHLALFIKGILAQPQHSKLVSLTVTLLD